MYPNLKTALRAAFLAATIVGLGASASAGGTTVLTKPVEFTGSFMMDHVATLDFATGIQNVDATGTGCVSGWGWAMCDNHATQYAYPDLTGVADYTIVTPVGTLVLNLVATPELGFVDQGKGIVRFGGTYKIDPARGTGLYRGACGEGRWAGSAEMTGPCDANGVFPPGPGRWAFWGTISYARRGCR